METEAGYDWRMYLYRLAIFGSRLTIAFHGDEGMAIELWSSRGYSGDRNHGRRKPHIDPTIGIPHLSFSIP